MADDASVDDAPEDFGAIADQVAAGILKNLPLDKVRDMIVGANVQGAHGVIASVFELLSELAALLAKGLVELEEPFLPVIASFVAPIIAGMYGTDVNASTFAARSNREGRGQAAQAIVEAYMRAMTGDGETASSPSDEGAKRIASAAVHATLEGSFQALITEL